MRRKSMKVFKTRLKRVLIFFLAFMMILSILDLSSINAKALNIRGNGNPRFFFYVPRSYMYFDGNKPVEISVSSNIVYNDDDTSYIHDYLNVRIYSEDFVSVTSKKKIDLDLPIFGGIYFGKNSIYVLSGKENSTGSDTEEVMRLEKYNYSWKKTGSLSFTDINTITPFYMASTDFAEYGDILYIRTSHETPDTLMGINAKGTMTFAINTKNMTIISSLTDVYPINICGRTSCGFVWNSDSQYIDIDGKDVVALDHTVGNNDIVICRYTGKAPEGIIDESVLCDFAEFYDDGTVKGIGGLGISSNNYLVPVIRSNNISLYVSPKDKINSSKKSVINLSNRSGSNLQIIEVKDDVFIILWEEMSLDSKVFSAVVDGNGNLLSDIQSYDAVLSDCRVICENGKLYWYAIGTYKVILAGSQQGYNRDTTYLWNTEPYIYEMSVNNSGNKYSTSLKPYVSEVKIKEGNETLCVGDTFTFTAETAPYSEVSKVKWESLDKSVAIVDKNGKVTAKKAGTTTIKASIGKISGSVTVTVRDFLSKKELTVTEGDYFSLEIDDYVYGKKANWIISDNSVVERYNNGTYLGSQEKFMAKKPGTATITLKVGDKTDKCVVTVVGQNAANEEQVKAFVTRFYTLILNRKPDETGINYWTQILLNKEQTGAQVAYGFVNSPEFTEEHPVNDTEFVKRMYATFFDRDGGSDGEAWWLGYLNKGYTRNYVLAGFTNSDEFKNLCAQYGIDQGSLPMDESMKTNPNPSPQPGPHVDGLNIDASNVDPAKLDEYIDRLYRLVLKREPEAEGKQYWREEIIKGNPYNASTAAEIGFFNSPEYLAMNKTDEEFIMDCYLVFLNREAEADGFEYWKEKFRTGEYDRQKLIEVGVGHSNEFKDILRSYGFVIIE